MTRLAMLLASTALITTGCVAEADIDSSVAESSKKQEVASFGFTDGAQVGGSEVEGNRRSPFSFKYETVATPNDTYTIWICGWDDPSECGGDVPAGEGNNNCAAPDLFSASFFCRFGGGAIADDDGELEIEGVDDPSGQLIFGDGLDNLRDAEIHLILRSHGPVLPDQLEAQLTTFEGGCDINVCEDQQFAILPPL